MNHLLNRLGLLQCNNLSIFSLKYVEIKGLIDQDELVFHVKFVLTYIELQNFTTRLIRLKLFKTIVVRIVEDATKFLIASIMIIIFIAIFTFIFIIIVFIFEVFLRLNPEQSTRILTLQRMMSCCGFTKRTFPRCVFLVLSLNDFSFFLDFNWLVSELSFSIRVSLQDFKVKVVLITKISIVLLDTLGPLQWTNVESQIGVTSHFTRDRCCLRQLLERCLLGDDKLPIDCIVSIFALLNQHAELSLLFLDRPRNEANEAASFRQDDHLLWLLLICKVCKNQLVAHWIEARVHDPWILELDHLWSFWYKLLVPSEAFYPLLITFQFNVIVFIPYLPLLLSKKPKGFLEFSKDVYHLHQSPLFVALLWIFRIN